MYSTLLLLVLALGAEAASCPSGYSIFNNVCYGVHSKTLNRTDAAAKCNSDGGYLASIHDDYVNTFIATLRRNADVNAIWLGIKSTDDSQYHCVNDDGSKQGMYTNFYINNPSAAYSCAYQSGKSPSTDYWISADCSKTLAFVCEITPGAVKKTTQKPTTTTQKGSNHNSCPSGYQQFENMCYSYVDSGHKTGRSSAATLCEMVPNGKLVSIHNERTNQFLYSLSGNDDAVWIGLVCSPVNVNGATSSCFWDDGTNFDFNDFAPSNPTKLGGACVNFGKRDWTNAVGADCFKGSNYFCQVPAS